MITDYFNTKEKLTFYMHDKKLCVSNENTIKNFEFSDVKMTQRNTLKMPKCEFCGMFSSNNFLETTNKTIYIGNS